MKNVLAATVSVVLILSFIIVFSTGKSQPKHTVITNVNLISMTGTEVE